MAQRYKFSIESKSFPLDISGEPKKFSKKIVDTPSVPLLALLEERLRGLRCGGPKTRLANSLSSGLRYLLCHAREQGAQGHKNR